MQTLDFRRRESPQDAALMRIVERELELRYLYCIGDERGEQSHLVSLGVSGRKNLAGSIETAQRWRSEKLVIHFQHVIRGEGALLRLKAGLENHWRPSWRRGSWWEKDGKAASLEVVVCAADERVPLLTDLEADELERMKLQEVFNRIARV
jgi:hypothetical protein